jgi:SAM-dependent methyltransferase
MPTFTSLQLGDYGLKGISMKTPAPANSDLRTEQALRGQALYGDDFSDEEIALWFEGEREGYFDLYGNTEPAVDKQPEYYYAGLAEEHGFKWLPERSYPSILGIGSADGAELLPLLPKCNKITILEPSDGFVSSHIGGKPVAYVKPNFTGVMPFDAGSFDVIVCFSALHHIPNVSMVIREMFRVLKPGGYVLLREPTHSMGDWRYPRRGLTKSERGIPHAIFRNIIVSAGFEVVRETLCMFSLVGRLSYFTSRPIWSFKWILQLDRLICRLPVWPQHYHPKRIWHKIRPAGVAFVLRKP